MCAFPIVPRQTGQGTVGGSAVLEPPFADEGFAVRLEALTGRRIDYISAFGGGQFMRGARASAFTKFG